MDNADTIDVVTINYVGTSFRMIECICRYALVAYDLTIHMTIFNTVHLRHRR